MARKGIILWTTIPRDHPAPVPDEMDGRWYMWPDLESARDNAFAGGHRLLRITLVVTEIAEVDPETAEVDR